jgi:hypothetical protein
VLEFGRNWTEARRFPLVLGKIGRWVMPFTLTLYQLGIFIGFSFAFLVTRPVWAIGPGLVNLTALLGIPATFAWASRYVRLEGRSPLSAALGYGSYLLAPKRGLYQGRPFRQPRGNRAERIRPRHKLRLVRR